MPFQLQCHHVSLALTTQVGLQKVPCHLYFHTFVCCISCTRNPIFSLLKLPQVRAKSGLSFKAQLGIPFPVNPSVIPFLGVSIVFLPILLLEHFMEFTYPNATASFGASFFTEARAEPDPSLSGGTCHRCALL